MLSVEKAKVALRITHDKLDEEILDTLNACILDLSMAGVDAAKNDALTDMAGKLYCRWKYSYGGKPEQYERAYTALKQAMSLCGDYQRGGGHV